MGTTSLFNPWKLNQMELIDWILICNYCRSILSHCFSPCFTALATYPVLHYSFYFGGWGYMVATFYKAIMWYLNKKDNMHLVKGKTTKTPPQLKVTYKLEGNNTLAALWKDDRLVHSWSWWMAGPFINGDWHRHLQHHEQDVVATGDSTSKQH